MASKLVEAGFKPPFKIKKVSNFNKSALTKRDLIDMYPNPSIDYDGFYIAKDSDGVGYTLYGEGEYNRRSVNEGQYANVALEFFDTIQEAAKAFPGVEIREEKPIPGFNTPSTEPSWFDSSAAGENWDED